MKQYPIKDSYLRGCVEFIVKDLLKDLTINKDYIIAGGFVRDAHLGLSPKDIDVFINDARFPVKLDFEMMIYNAGATHVKLLSGEEAEKYAGQRATSVSDWAVKLLNPTPPAPIPQDAKEITCVQDTLFPVCSYPIQFIHCTLDKGFTPRSLINTFDYNVIRGYVDNDLNLALADEAVEGFETKTVKTYIPKGHTSFRKTEDRVFDWVDRKAPYLSVWTFTQAVEDPQTVSYFKKTVTPYLDRIMPKNGHSTSPYATTATYTMPLR